MAEDAIYEISENLHHFLICYGHLICDFLYFGTLCRDVRDVIYDNIWLSRLRENKHGSWGYVYTKFGDNRATYRFRRVRWRPSLREDAKVACCRHNGFWHLENHEAIFTDLNNIFTERAYASIEGQVEKTRPRIY